ncbi:MAG: GH25 family lysozyme [Dorea sp.]
MKEQVKIIALMTNDLKIGKRMKKNKYIRMSVVIMMGIMCVSGMPSNAYAIENNAEISDGNVLQNTTDESYAENNDINPQEELTDDNDKENVQNQSLEETDLNEAEKNDEANSWRYQNGKLIVQDSTNSRAARYAARSVAPWTNIDGNFYNSLGQKIEGVVAKGIDVSEHNGQIDWNKVKNTDVNYAIIRCGYGMNQTNQDDRKWSYNVSECERLGIPYGVYIYSYADSVQKAASEAEHVLRLIEGKKLTYPIYYDLEEIKVRNKVSAAEIAKIAETFCNKIEAAGYTVGIYANTDWFTNYLTDATFNNYKKWVAQYNYKCTYSGKYLMWQCSDKGSVNGITTAVDLNMDFGTLNGIHLVEEDGATYCYSGTQKLYGEQKINNSWYYFDENQNGKMIKATFWNLPGKIVYYGDNGAMRYGEQKINEKWYYFEPVTGAMQTGFLNVGNKIVYYNNEGYMIYGEQNINGEEYYFNTFNGAMFTGFRDTDIGKVYYGTNGAKCHGEQRINEKWYYFDPATGAMQTGFVDLGSKTVYYSTTGSMCYGEKQINGKWYYFEPVTGAMQTGFVNLGSKVVYYNTKGEMQYGEQKIGDNRYYFSTWDGAMYKGFRNEKEGKVYYKTDGSKCYGEQKINEKWYYFDPATGAMQTGFVDLGSKTVYYSTTGSMCYGEKQINGKWYYFEPVTGAMQTGFVNLGSKVVYYNTKGEMQYGEQKIGDNRYYFSTWDGAMLKNGWKNKHYYNNDGIRIK